jgi:hypothetical protein
MSRATWNREEAPPTSAIDFNLNTLNDIRLSPDDVCRRGLLTHGRGEPFRDATGMPLDTGGCQVFSTGLMSERASRRRRAPEKLLTS